VSTKKPVDRKDVAAPARLLQQLNSPASPRASSSPRQAPADVERIARYQLHVFAPNIADAVASVGGLIFDRAMAGWDVTVLVDGDLDDRPVRILGGRVASTMSALDRAEVPRPQAMAVATEVLVNSEQLRRLVLAARKASEVLLWGRPHPPNLNCRFVPVHHQPSAAAHVFKSHALAAGGGAGSPLTEEGFYSVT
jgi:hypothetical protein